MSNCSVGPLESSEKKRKYILLQVAPVYVKPDTAAIHERIGFDPKPKLQWADNQSIGEAGIPNSHVEHLVIGGSQDSAEVTDW